MRFLRFFKPVHTAESVAASLIDGLADGSISLREDQKPAQSPSNDVLSGSVASSKGRRPELPPVGDAAPPRTVATGRGT